MREINLSSSTPQRTFWHQAVGGIFNYMLASVVMPNTIWPAPVSKSLPREIYCVYKVAREIYYTYLRLWPDYLTLNQRPCDQSSTEGSQSVWNDLIRSKSFHENIYSGSNLLVGIEFDRSTTHCDWYYFLKLKMKNLLIYKLKHYLITRTYWKPELFILEGHFWAYQTATF